MDIQSRVAMAHTACCFATMGSSQASHACPSPNAAQMSEARPRGRRRSRNLRRISCRTRSSSTRRCSFGDIGRSLSIRVRSSGITDTTRPRADGSARSALGWAQAKELRDSVQKKSAEIRVLPMELRIGDRFMDETGEWEVIGRPFATAGGKNAHARVRKVGQPELTDLRSWSAHERIAVRRA